MSENDDDTGAGGDDDTGYDDDGYELLDPDNAEIEEDDSSFEIEMKRMYLPIRINWTCPWCDEIHVHDFKQDYLGYPRVNEPMDLALYCPDCDTEGNGQPQFALRIMPKFSIEIVPLDSDEDSDPDPDPEDDEDAGETEAEAEAEGGRP